MKTQRTIASTCSVLYIIMTVVLGSDRPMEMIFQRSAQPHKSAIASLAFSPDSTLLAAGCGIDASIGGWGDLSLFDVKSMKLIKTYKGYETPVLAVAFAPDGKTIAAGGYPIMIWDVPSGTRRLKVKPPGTVMNIVYRPDLDIMVTTSRGERAAVVWNTKDGARLAGLDSDPNAKEGMMSALDVSKDGKILVTGGYNRNVTLWDSSTWKMMKPLRESQTVENVSIVRFGGSDSVVFTKGSSKGLLWNLKDGTLKCELQQNHSPLNDAAFSPDGRLLATATSVLPRMTPENESPGIQLWDAETGKRIHQIRGHYSAVAFSPDGQILAVGSSKGIISIYRLRRSGETPSEKADQ